MLSLGDVREEPIPVIWERMSSLFRGPGCDCYANRIHDTVAALNLKTWPVPPELSKQVVNKVPPHDPNNLPEFFKKMGFKRN